MFGFININKPHGVTSRDVVNQIQRRIEHQKVGHCGTLDPIATGVLVLGIGSATRLVEFVQRMPKSYQGKFLLGWSSETLDVEGNIFQTTGAPVPSRKSVLQTLQHFQGKILQQPPQYSAIKVGGRRAYEVARSGKRVELAPREVNIYEISLVDYTYPELTLEITCSGGTYIRAIGRDFASRLNTSAVMHSLCRTAIGEFKISDSLSLESLNKESISQSLLPPQLAVSHLGHVDLSGDQLEDVSHGRKISISGRPLSPTKIEKIAAFFDNNLVCILQSTESLQWTPCKVFVSGTSKIRANGKV